MKFRRATFTLAILFSITISSTTLRGEDVLRFRGSNSQGTYNETGLMKSWPSEGLTPLWINENLGDGWSSVIKVDDKLYLNCLVADDPEFESIACLDLKGKILWQTKTGQCWSKSYPGGRSTPTYVKGSEASKDRLVVCTGSGQICSLDPASGKLLWKKDVATAYQSEPGRWGYAESLVVKDNKIFVTVGGPLATVVAVNLENGSLIWKSESNGDNCAYVTPVLSNNTLIQLTSTYVIGVDIHTGKQLWKTNYSALFDGKRKGINCNSPLIKGNRFFVTAGYNQGGVMYEILPENTGIKMVWKTDVLDTHHGGVVELNGRIYGSSWESNSGGKWVCLDWNTGNKIYEEPWENFGKGSIVTADQMLYIYEEKRGNFGLVKAGDTFEVVSKFPIRFGSKQHWSHPVICDGILYVRHGEALASFDIRQKSK